MGEKRFDRNDVQKGRLVGFVSAVVIWGLWTLLSAFVFTEDFNDVMAALDWSSLVGALILILAFVSGLVINRVGDHVLDKWLGIDS